MSKNRPDKILTYDKILAGGQPVPENFGRIIVHYWLPDGGRERCDTTELQVEALRSVFTEGMMEVREEFAVLLLTDELELVGPYLLYQANVDEVTTDYRDVIRTACLVPGVSNIVIGHNHPDGNILPSEADVRNANGLAHALSFCGLHLSDSIVLSRSDHYSLHDSGLIRV